MEKKNIHFIRLVRCPCMPAILTGVVFLIFISFLICGCGTKRVYIPVERKVIETVTMRDTIVRTELISYRDTISINLQAGMDTVSFLENPYAFSYASFKKGTLNHSLGIKPGSYAEGKVQVKEVHIVDSIPYPVEIKGNTETIYKLYWWQKYLLYSGLAANVFILLYLGRKCRKG